MNHDLNAASLGLIDKLLVGNNYDDETLTKILPAVLVYLEGVDQLRAADLADVPNALVMVAGGRKS